MSLKRGKREAREAREEIARLNAEVESLNKELAQSKQPKRATKK